MLILAILLPDSSSVPPQPARANPYSSNEVIDAG
jgi:hypothetical protein